MSSLTKQALDFHQVQLRKNKKLVLEFLTILVSLKYTKQTWVSIKATVPHNLIKEGKLREKILKKNFSIWLI